MASATIASVDFTDSEQVYTVDVRRNNGTLIQTIEQRFPITFDPQVVQAQIAAACQDVIERSRPRNQRRQLTVGTAIDLG